MRFFSSIFSRLAFATAPFLFLLASHASAVEPFECGPTGVKCIEVGGKFLQPVTSGRLGMQCVDNNSQPDHERITLSVSGAPDTGGATATFGANVIRAYEAGTTLTIQTRYPTKAGQYVIKVGGVGEHCGSYPGFQVFLWVVPYIYFPADIWTFDGPQPAGYPDRIVLTAEPRNRPPYDWYIREGSRNYLSFANGSNYIRTNGNKVIVIGQQATLAGVPVGVEVSSAGSPVSQRERVDVLRPHDIVQFSRRDYPNAEKGYSSVTRYRLRDQYGSYISGANLPINITFGPEYQFIANNWIKPAAPHYLVAPTDLKVWIYPATAGGNPVDIGNPRPEAPRGAGAKVDCWRAAIYVGSLTPGVGVRVDTLTWLRYRDHATSTHLNCPP